MGTEARATYVVLGHERISKGAQDAARRGVAWTPGAGLMPAFLSAEMFRAAGLEAQVIDCTAIGQFVTEDEKESPVPGRPCVRIGDVDPALGVPSDHAVVIVKEASGQTLLFDPALSRLKHPEFFAHGDVLLATTYDDVAADLAADNGQFTTALEWVEHAPGGGRVKLAWGLRCGKPSWFAEAQRYEREAKTLLQAAKLSKVGMAIHWSHR